MSREARIREGVEELVNEHGAALDRLANDAACSDPLCSYRAEIESGYYVRSAHSLPVGDDSPSLDAERLARALNATVGTLGWLRSAPSAPVDEWRENARWIAAEYARLSKEDTDDRP